MEPFDKIRFHQFISYMDEDGFIYGFEIASIYNLFLKNGYDTTNVKNPYNRNFIPHALYDTINRLIKLSFVLKREINLDIEDDSESISPPKAVELRALELFQRIDSLGNYSDSIWFLSLNRGELVSFMRNLGDIFNYRAQLSNEIKRNICPPNGNPFWNFNLGYIQTEENMNNVKNSILEILENFVNRGINEDSKSLGAYYVLAALTLVNELAATALPWLFQSVTFF
jgi:AAA+ ATPase superfamily predicted ATPase